MPTLPRHSEIIIPAFDPLDLDVGLVDAVRRYLREQEEIAMANDLLTGDLLEYALLHEEDCARG
jgi:hypothetical protein